MQPNIDAWDRWRDSTVTLVKRALRQHVPDELPRWQIESNLLAVTKNPDRFAHRAEFYEEQNNLAACIYSTLRLIGENR